MAAMDENWVYCRQDEPAKANGMQRVEKVAEKE